MIPNDVKITVKDGRYYLIICGFVAQTSVPGEVVIPDESPDLHIELTPQLLGRLASDLAYNGYVRI